MGKKGRAIAKADVKRLLRDLNAAYAEEWIAFFCYTWAADFVERTQLP